MTGEWERIEELFHECLALDEAGRTARLAGEPADVRDWVRRLLESSGRGDRVSRVIQKAAALATQPADSVGPYRLVREIGQGGMGSVYLAVRADHTFERQVAVKFVRHGLDSELRRRFDAERRILARLEHPYIARLLDAGQTASGQPYLVMEYVQGQTITAYSTEGALSLRERIALFLKVCDAVQYAHQSLIVHRDLKPGNIFIDESGDPKLLDFGIAKLLAGDEAPSSQTQIRVHTPDYASPEQVRGEAVTTATDVYSLGAVLFELLAVKPDPATPRRPSECNPQAARELRGDLDNIVMKAMRPEPAARYTTVAELSADLDRYLAGRPVHARDYTVWQRTAKFVMRHRVIVAAACAVVVSLAAAAMIAGRSAMRAEVARQQAVLERKKADDQRQEAQRQEKLARDREAEAGTQRSLADRRLQDHEQVLSTFLQDFYRDVRDLNGAADVRKRMLAAGIKQLESIRAERPQDREVARTLALGYEEMGRVLGEPGADPAGGRKMLLRAAAMFEELHRDEPDKLSYLLELSTTCHYLSQIQSDSAGERQAALASAETAVKWSRAAVAQAPGDLEAQDALARALTGRIQLLVSGDISRMRMEDVAEARRIIESHLQKQPNQPSQLMLLSNTYSAEKEYHRMRLNYEAALPLAEKSLELREQASAQLRNDITVLRSLMGAYNSVADLIRPAQATGAQLQRAQECYERAAAIAERLVLGDPADHTAQYNRALGFVRLASFFDGRGDAATAFKHAEHGLEAFRAMRAELERNVTWDTAFVATLLVYEGICRKVGRTDAVEPALREALKESFAVAQRDQRPESPYRTASLAAERLAEWVAGRDAASALDYAEQAVHFAERARAVPGAGPFTVLRLAQARGEAALLFARLAEERSDEKLRTRARTLAAASTAVMGELKEPQMATWPVAARERVKALVR